MKYVNFLELQKKYKERKKVIKAMREFKSQVWHNHSDNETLNWLRGKTDDMFEACNELIRKEIERLEEELNEMEITETDIAK